MSDGPSTTFTVVVFVGDLEDRPNEEVDPSRTERIRRVTQ